MNNISGAGNIETILEDNGYPIKRGADYISTAGLWRNGDNDTAICIYPAKNLVIDFVTSEKFSIHALIGKILGIEGEENITEYLNNNNLNFAPKNDITEPLIKEVKTIKQDFIQKLDKSDSAQSYWVNRGIDINLLKELGGGVYKNKYYFPVYNSKKECLGYSCRVIKGESDKRYLIRGQKKEFVYPAFVNSKDIAKAKRVYLVEGISDGISLMSVGIRNVLVLFGTECSFAIVNFLLKIPDVEIVIAVNSDSAGVEASKKIKNKLSRYFDNYSIKTTLPKNFKDWNEILLTKGGKDTIIEMLKI